MRMFAGPNGSGKSILKSYLPPAQLGVYLNADEIEAAIRLNGGAFDLMPFGLPIKSAEVLSAFGESTFLASEGLSQAASRVSFADGVLHFPEQARNSYFASVLMGFLRRKLIEIRASFSFETVMSHHGKVQELASAQAAGYRTYLYYVATRDPLINVSRVENRVLLGGHAVPRDKIISRYHRSLALLKVAIRYTDRAYIFDNSAQEEEDARGAHTWLAEITRGADVELKTQFLPEWFKSALQDDTV